MRRLVTTKTISLLLISIVVGLITSVGIAWVAVVDAEISTFKYGIKGQFLHSQNDSGWHYTIMTGYSWRGKAWKAILSGVCDEKSTCDIDAGQLVRIQGSEYQLVRFEGLNYPVFSFLGPEVRPGPWWSRTSHTPVLTNNDSNKIMLEEVWGWPFVCLASNREGYSITYKRSNPVLLGALGQPYTAPKPHLVSPIWVGLLANTSIFTIIIYILLLLASLLIEPMIKIRNSVRVKRGLCQFCCYILRDLPVCPECGSEATKPPAPKKFLNVFSIYLVVQAVLLLLITSGDLPIITAPSIAITGLTAVMLYVSKIRNLSYTFHIAFAVVWFLSLSSCLPLMLYYIFSL